MVNKRSRQSAGGLNLTDYPPGIVRIIEKRVGQLLPALPVLNYDLRRLLASAYMQGVNDGLETIAHGERTGQLTLTMGLAEALRENG
jgi:hypothetical protein